MTSVIHSDQGNRMDDQSHRLTEDLVAVVGAEHVLQGSAVRESYRRDKSPFPAVVPGVIVRPGSVAEVSEVLRLVDGSGCAVMPYGGGFSLTGYPPVDPDTSVVVDVSRLNRVLEIDDLNMTVTAEAGVVMSDLEAQVAARGFQVHTVSVPIRHTTLGGVLSGVVSGGLPQDGAAAGGGIKNLLGLTVVLADGRVISTNAGGSNVHRTGSAVLDGDGPCLTPLFVGDGGSLGVKVEATLQLIPAAPVLESGYWSMPDLDSVWQAMTRLTAIRETPYTALSAAEGPPWAIAYAARASDATLMDWQVRTIEHILKECGGEPGPEEMRVVARAMASSDPRWVDRFLTVDRALLAFIFAKRDFLGAFDQICSMLRARILEGGLAERGVRLMVYFSPHTRHAVYSTISIIYDRDVRGGEQAALSLARAGYALVTELGGYSEPRQGEGFLLAAEGWSPEYRGLVTQLKRTLDPNNTLNPALWPATSTP
ncbi:MAG: hypothetical protein JWP95_324 [Actinotalea sp.]|nr:hypothetical protein [Actinotalea sp.]